MSWLYEHLVQRDETGTTFTLRTRRSGSLLGSAGILCLALGVMAVAGALDKSVPLPILILVVAAAPLKLLTLALFKQTVAVGPASVAVTHENFALFFVARQAHDFPLTEVARVSVSRSGGALVVVAVRNDAPDVVLLKAAISRQLGETAARAIAAEMGVPCDVSSPQRPSP